MDRRCITASEVTLKGNDEGKLSIGRAGRVNLVISCIRQEEWLKVWIYMDSWARV